MSKWIDYQKQEYKYVVVTGNGIIWFETVQRLCMYWFGLTLFKLFVFLQSIGKVQATWKSKSIKQKSIHSMVLEMIIFSITELGFGWFNYDKKVTK